MIWSIILFVSSSRNVGIQVHHIDPITAGDIVWYLYPQDVIAIARLFAEGNMMLQESLL